MRPPMNFQARLFPDVGDSEIGQPDEAPTGFGNLNLLDDGLWILSGVVVHC